MSNELAAEIIIDIINGAGKEEYYNYDPLLNGGLYKYSIPEFISREEKKIMNLS